VLRTVASLPFRALAAARGARAFHPQGFLCRGTWTVERTSPLAPGAQVLQAGAEHPCIVRLSRGAGLPEWLPDVYGISVRLEDAYGPGRHQDLLINSSADLPVVHHVFLPSPRWYGQSHSTCLPYRAGAGLVLIGLQPPRRRGPEPSVDAMRAEVARGTSYGIAVAASLGRWEPIGTLALRDPLAPEFGDVDFDPWNTGGGLVPATWLNRWRREAYRQSRLGRGAPAEV
jgi:hypothetical protein